MELHIFDVQIVKSSGVYKCYQLRKKQPVLRLSYADVAVVDMQGHLAAAETRPRTYCPTIGQAPACVTFAKRPPRR